MSRSSQASHDSFSHLSYVPAPRVIERRSPVTGEKLYEFTSLGPVEVRAAVARARRALPGWSRTPLLTRLERLERLRSVILERGESLARRLSEDTGKPLVDSLLTELMTIPLFLEHYRKVAPRVLARRRVRTPIVFFGKKSYVEHFPIGVVGILSPWNFPLQLSVVPALSALIGGNTVVIKPSEVTPLCGEIVRELFAAIPLPVGVVEVVQGDGATGAALVEAGLDKVFFTGSVPTGRRVMAAAAKGPIPVDLELGGKDAMIVCGDANLHRAAKGAVWGGLMNCGQACNSVERVLVVAPVHDRTVELMRREMARIRVGAPGEDADVGPMTSAAQLEIVDKQVRQAVAAGARLVHGGRKVERAGLFYEPTLLVGVTPEMSVYSEETFGPVLSVVRVKDEDEAVRLANDHAFGLSASVWTADQDRGLEIASRLECGQVMVNDVVSSEANPALPFGGAKASGFGRYHGEEGLTTFQQKRAIMVGGDRKRAEPFWFPYSGKLPEVRRAFHSLLKGDYLRVLAALFRLDRMNAASDRAAGLVPGPLP
jgi:acyl-CoA reductase-like NAD-dependent aldehyde dehydrogenase